jgi:hypothetical protein
MFILQGLPEGTEIVRESRPPPERPGRVHGQEGPRLIVESAAGLVSSHKTGRWKWCAGCGWVRSVGVVAPFGCGKCHKAWE